MQHGCIGKFVRESTEKSMRWETIPFRAVVPLIPEFPVDFEPRPGDGPVPLVGAHTQAIRLASIEEATTALLRSYRRRVDRGDRRALGELLDVNPEFIMVEWVAEAVARHAEAELSIRRRGRRRGTYRRSPLFVIGLVEHVVRTKREANLEQAFGWLEKHEVLSYDRVKALYYQGHNDSRLRAFLINHPAGIGLASPPDKQVKAWLAQTGWPAEKPATIITNIGVVAIDRRPGRTPPEDSEAGP